MKAAPTALVLLGLAACSPQPPNEPDEQRAKSACISETFEGNDFTRCTAVPGKHTIRTVVAGPDGAPLRDLQRLADSLGEKSDSIAFATNGGMYDEAGQPIGYYIEAGERLKKLNRAKGGGNFHLLPNGVFSVEADGWHVRSAERFAEEVRKRPAYATQSGPMLVIAGKLHPSISDNGESLHIRNAVGVDRQGRAHFVISEQAVSFGRLARYFRDRLMTPDALYLDGSVSALWDPARDRLDRTVPLGPLIVVEKAGKGSA